MPGSTARTGEAKRGRLAQRRKAVGLTQEQLAEQLGVERSTVVRWERGETQPLPWLRPQLARVLKVSADRLGELLAASPAARDGAAPAVPRQLPTAVPGFAGRTAELAALTRLLQESVADSPGTVVISAIGGTAGVGKTALALHWAHQVADRFADGQLYVNLRGFDPSGVPMPAAEAVRGFLDALGVAPDRIPLHPEAQAGLYRSLLADRRMLIVLDNGRDEQQVRPLLPASQGSLVIITSRSQLAGLAGDRARLLTLDVLSQGEAMHMLTGRIGASRAAAEPAAAGEIASLCGRLPLALAVAAARGPVCAARPAARLRCRPGPQHRQPARPRCRGRPGAGPLPAHRPRRRLHGAPSFGPIPLAPPSPGTAPEQFTRGEQALAWFEAEYHVLLAAVALAVDSGLDSHGWLISWAMHPFLATQGHNLEWNAVKRMAIAAGIRDHAAVTGSGTHKIARTLGEYQWVPQYYADSLKLYQQLGNRRGEAQCLYSLAALAEYQGQYAQALAYAEQAIYLCRAIGNKAGETELLNWAGWYHALLGDYQQARGLCRQALALNTDYGSRHLEGNIWNSLGYTEFHVGDFGEATACYQRALNIFRTVGDRWGEADTLSNVGDVRRAVGEALPAWEAWQQALAILDDLHHPDAAKVRAKLASMDR